MWFTPGIKQNQIHQIKVNMRTGHARPHYITILHSPNVHCTRDPWGCTLRPRTFFPRMSKLDVHRPEAQLNGLSHQAAYTRIIKLLRAGPRLGWQVCGALIARSELRIKSGGRAAWSKKPRKYTEKCVLASCVQQISTMHKPASMFKWDRDGICHILTGSFLSEVGWSWQ